MLGSRECAPLSGKGRLRRGRVGFPRKGVSAMAKGDDKELSNDFGAPVDSDLFSMTAGEHGPILIQDTHLTEKLAHFDRERIPERVVHAKGAGAHGLSLIHISEP